MSKLHRIKILHIIKFSMLLSLFIAQTNYPKNNIHERDQLLFEHEFNIYTPEQVITRSKKTTKKDWTFIVYIAADNDLRNFSVRNIKQMAAIGSTDHVNIVVHIDIRLTRDNKITRRYLIEKDHIVHVNASDPLTQKMDSGDPKTLISCCKWAIQDYPAENYALIFWNHGTGCLDPIRGRVINPMELFSFNPNINKLELDRTIGYLDLINRNAQELRGICWDDSTGNYLTNQKIDMALSEICTKYLQGEKFSLIGFDACLMSMVEVANMMKKYANIMVGSQEVELGTGWDYSRVLAPFLHNTLSKQEFASHIVNTYEATYNTITNDYTQAAVNLDSIDLLESNINEIAKILIEALNKQKNNSVRNAIKASSARSLCTYFDEPSYKDLHHFYNNLLINLKHISLINKNEEFQLNLSKKLNEGLAFIDRIVFTNKAGKNLSRAQGLSIYLPERKIHSSYQKTPFAHSNAWSLFLNHYINS